MADKVNGVCFQYEPLANPQTTIRLLRIEPGDGPIHCTMKCGLIEKGTYSCLSYTWGDASQLECIYIDSRPCTVRENLYDFLHTARRYGVTESLWIDALCINQEDLVEKSLQVRLMGRIYAESTRVIVWLGDILTDDELEGLVKVQHVLEGRVPRCWCIPAGKEQSVMRTNMEEILCEGPVSLDTRLENMPSKHCHCDFRLTSTLVSRLNRNRRWRSATARDRCHLLFTPNTEISIDLIRNQAPMPRMEIEAWQQGLNVDHLLESLYKAPYWDRAWIVQEVVLGSSIELLTASESLKVETLLNLIVARTPLWNYQTIGLKSSESTSKTFSKGVRTLLTCMEISIPGGNQIESHRFGRLLQVTDGRLCQDYRDRIFSVVSLTRDADLFGIDYNISDLELYSRCLQHGARENGGMLVKGDGYASIRTQGLAGRVCHILRLEPPRAGASICLSGLVNATNITTIESGYTSFWAKIDIEIDDSVKSDRLLSVDHALCTRFEEAGRTWLLAHPWTTDESRLLFQGLWELKDCRWQRIRSYNMQTTTGISRMGSYIKTIV